MRYLRPATFAVVLLALLLAHSLVLEHLAELNSRTFGHVRLYILVHWLGYLVLGVLLGLVHLVTQRGRTGRRTIDWPRLAIVGGPLLLLSMGHLLPWLGVPWSLTRLIAGHGPTLWQTIIPGAAVALGYVLSTSLRPPGSPQSQCSSQP